MFASFLWTVTLVTVCRADGSAVEHRLKPFTTLGVVEAVLSEYDRRRNEDDGGDETVLTLEEEVTRMAAQAGFRYKTCIRKAPFGGFSKSMLVNFAPAILGDLMTFSTERRRWGFNKNNFIANIADPLAGLPCENVYQLCNIKAMRLFQDGLADRQASVQNSYRPFVSSSNMDYFVSCAYAEIPQICNKYKALMCPEESEN